MADQGKTYQDLMMLLPEVSTIAVSWIRDEDGDFRGVGHVTLAGHDGEVLISIDADQVEELPQFVLEALDARQLDLIHRMPAVLTVIEWLDPWELEEAEDGSAIIVLPSALHVPDEPPTEWTS